MKARDFASVLSAYADFLATHGNQRDAQKLTGLYQVFASDGTSTVAALLKRFSKTEADRAPATGSTSDDAGVLLTVLQRLLSPAAKTTVLNDLKAVLSFLTDHPNFSLTALVELPQAASDHRMPTERSPVREALVEKYLQQLEANLGDADSFGPIYDDLATGDPLSRGELILLSQRFAGSTTRSKDSALKKIWTRHQRLMTSQAKAKATSGRSAG